MLLFNLHSSPSHKTPSYTQIALKLKLHIKLDMVFRIVVTMATTNSQQSLSDKFISPVVSNRETETTVFDKRVLWVLFVHSREAALKFHFGVIFAVFYIFYCFEKASL